MFQKVDLNQFLFNGVTLIVILSCYFVDRSFTFKDVAKYVDLIFYAILVIINLIFFIINGVSRYDFKYFVLIFLSLIPPLFFRGYLNFHWLYVVVFFIVLRISYTPSNKFMTIILFLCLISVAVQMYVYKSSDGRPTLSIEDPNYSSYFVAILMMLSLAYNKKFIFISLTLLATLMISRVFFLWLSFFMGLYFLRSYFNKLPRISSFLYFIIIIFVPIFFSLAFVYFVPEISVIYSSDYSRLTSISDKSNLDRALANLYYINSIFESPVNLFSGFDFESYTENIFYNTPHASIYSTLFNYGIFFVLIEIFLFKKYFRKITKYYLSYAFMISWIVWQCFLGGVLFGPQIILLAIIINSFNKYNIYIK